MKPSEPIMQGRTISHYRPHKDFGAWKLAGDCLVLKRDRTREVDLERCYNAFEILDWILHYQYKVSPEELMDLVRAFQVILDPRKNYRTSRGNNPTALLREHLSKTKNNHSND